MLVLRGSCLFSDESQLASGMKLVELLRFGPFVGGLVSLPVYHGQSGQLYLLYFTIHCNTAYGGGGGGVIHDRAVRLSHIAHCKRHCLAGPAEHRWVQESRRPIGRGGVTTHYVCIFGCRSSHLGPSGCQASCWLRHSLSILQQQWSRSTALSWHLRGSTAGT
jgi:hypothetical protein